MGSGGGKRMRLHFDEADVGAREEGAGGEGGREGVGCPV